MINVKKTLASTIKDKVDRLRYLSENNPHIFKKILYLIILDDLYDWANYREDKIQIQEALRQKRLDFIYNNTEFIIERDQRYDFYTNVNLPQTESTWKRTWDQPNYQSITNYTEVFPEQPTSFVPDPTCSIEVVYFPNDKVGVAPDGKPSVDLNLLSTCEKMNIYINRETGVLYYLDEHCNWKPLKTDIDDGSITKNKLAFDLYNGIRHYINVNGKTIDVELFTTDPDHPLDNGITIVDKESLNDILV